MRPSRRRSSDDRPDHTRISGPRLRRSIETKENKPLQSAATLRQAVSTTKQARVNELITAEKSNHAFEQQSASDAKRAQTDKVVATRQQQLQDAANTSRHVHSVVADISTIHSELLLLRRQRAAAIDSGDYGVAKTLKGEIDEAEKSLTMRIDEAEEADKATNPGLTWTGSRQQSVKTSVPPVLRRGARFEEEELYRRSDSNLPPLRGDFCEQCGTLRAANAKFCTVCGTGVPGVNMVASGGVVHRRSSDSRSTYRVDNDSMYLKGMYGHTEICRRHASKSGEDTEQCTIAAPSTTNTSETLEHQLAEAVEQRDFKTAAELQQLLDQLMKQQLEAAAEAARMKAAEHAAVEAARLHAEHEAAAEKHSKQPRAAAPNTREALEHELAEAVKQRDFGRAAVLQDQVDQLMKQQLRQLELSAGDAVAETEQELASRTHLDQNKKQVPVQGSLSLMLIANVIRRWQIVCLARLVVSWTSNIRATVSSYFTGCIDW